mmetsp:Transcript_41849/g.135394  ORF Transcript_41849/g.135394 Transcript_41849/m.135394 type:complete len:275 (+) Transcript_41849:2525-3349(+)
MPNAGDNPVLLLVGRHALHGLAQLGCDVSATRFLGAVAGHEFGGVGTHAVRLAAEPDDLLAEEAVAHLGRSCARRGRRRPGRGGSGGRSLSHCRRGSCRVAAFPLPLCAHIRSSTLAATSATLARRRRSRSSRSWSRHGKGLLQLLQYAQEALRRKVRLAGSDFIAPEVVQPDKGGVHLVLDISRGPLDQGLQLRDHLLDVIGQLLGRRHLARGEPVSDLARHLLDVRDRALHGLRLLRCRHGAHTRRPRAPKTRPPRVRRCLLGGGGGAPGRA